VEVISKTRDKIEKIRNISFFKYISSEDFAEAEKYISIIKFKSGEDIVREGERAGGLFIIISGVCKVIKGNVEVGKVRAEEFFGEGEILLQSPAYATIRAESDEVEVVYMIRGGIEQLERKNPRFTSTLYKLIAKIEMKRLLTLDREYVAVIDKLENIQRKEELKKIREKMFGEIKE